VSVGDISSMTEWKTIILRRFMIQGINFFGKEALVLRGISSAGAWC